MMNAWAATALALLCLAGSAAPEGEPGLPHPSEVEEETSPSASEPGSAEPPGGDVRAVRPLPGAFPHFLLLLRRSGASVRPTRRGNPAAGSPRPLPGGVGMDFLGSPPSTSADVDTNPPMQVWRRTIQRGGDEQQGRVVLPLSPGEVTKTSCKALPFNQTISQRGCSSVSIHNHFCFGHCSSFYVPGSQRDSSRPCSGCAPRRVRTVVVSLRCGRQALARAVEVTVVEECQCEASQASLSQGLGRMEDP
ncbi:DAN domain family member 5-like [Rhinatrema bivittatum]|uniref:DAN domain family member 5-like n=1 Tax=Rhinatrema bivittatum TaxID=194408 RepID=UPI00112D7BED|nr:DAN domain family member 5-like [Rhinatrema bivittatum]XP_029441519.1 DAN domain family member 5-like [Rhinatrema bivittatum]